MLVIVRHGQSTWNLENRFTGWVDVDLTDTGVAEAREGGRALADDGYLFDIVHTSVQIRAIRTANLICDELEQLWLPVRRSWRLNERHYGALQGLNKAETAERHGAEQLKEWRRGYRTPPPPLPEDSPMHPRLDRRYVGLPDDVLPRTECLADVLDRMLPYWEDAIAPDIVAGRNVLVVAHGNSLRGLIKHLEGISDDDIAELNLPTGVPLRYDFDERLRVTGERVVIGDAEAAAAAAEAVARQAG